MSVGGLLAVQAWTALMTSSQCIERLAGTAARRPHAIISWDVSTSACTAQLLPHVVHHVQIGDVVDGPDSPAAPAVQPSSFADPQARAACGPIAR